MESFFALIVSSCSNILLSRSFKVCLNYSTDCVNNPDFRMPCNFAYASSIFASCFRLASDSAFSLKSAL